MSRLFPGQIFQKRYRIESKIGAGGMGVVFKATQLDSGRTVAIKFLKAEALHAEGDSERFLREFQLLSRLSHPGIVSFISYGISDQGQHFAVCEYIEGISLSGLLSEKRRLDWRTAAGLAAQIAEALAYAHSQSIIHRDLKPSNVLLTQERGTQITRLIDFGLARAKNLTEFETLTKTGLLLGSVHYMSPEQAQSQELDGRSDIYSLGCVIYELISGKALFDAEHPLATLTLHCHKDPGPSIESLAELAPLKLLDLLKQMLAKSPERRPDDMNLVSILLQEICKDPELIPQKRSLFQRQRKSLPKLALPVMLVLLLPLCIYLPFSLSRKTGLQRSMDNKDFNPAARKNRHSVKMRRNFSGFKQDVESSIDDPELQKIQFLNWLARYGQDPEISAAEKSTAFLAAYHERSTRKEADLSQLRNLLSRLNTGDSSERLSAARLLILKMENELQSGNAVALENSYMQLCKLLPEKISNKRDEELAVEVSLAFVCLEKYKDAENLYRKLTKISKSFLSFENAADLEALLEDREDALRYYDEAYRLLSGKSDIMPDKIQERISKSVVPGKRAADSTAQGANLLRISGKIAYLDPQSAALFCQESLLKFEEEIKQGLKFSGDDKYWDFVAGLAQRLKNDTLAVFAKQQRLLLARAKLSECNNGSDLFATKAAIARLMLESKPFAGVENRVRAMNYFQEALSEFCSQKQPFDRNLYVVQCLQTAITFRQASREFALKLLEDAEVMMHQRKDERWPGSTLALCGSTFGKFGKQKTASRYFAESLKVLKQDLENKLDWTIASAILTSAGHFKESEELIKSRMALKQQDLDCALMFQSLALAELNAGSKKKSKEHFQTAFSIQLRQKPEFLSQLNENLVYNKLGILAASR